MRCDLRILIYTKRGTIQGYDEFAPNRTSSFVNRKSLTLNFFQLTFNYFELRFRSCSFK